MKTPLDLANAPAMATLSTNPEEPVSLSGVRILLAEDNECNQYIVQKFLSLAGAETKVVGDGRQAVELALGQHFDLILMDMQMPELDGCEATLLLRSSGSTVPIIALTGNTLPEERVKCLNAGCNGYLAKPIQRNVLLETIQRTIRGLN